MSITATDNLDGFVLSHGAAAADYVSIDDRPTGLRPDLLSFNGAVAFKVASFTMGLASSGNTKVTVVGTVIDDGSVDNGKKIIKHIPLTGMNVQGEENVKQWYTFVESTGVTVDKIRGLANKNEPFLATYSELIGRTSFCFVRAEKYLENSPTSGITKFITEKLYNREMAAGTRSAHNWTGGVGGNGISAATVATAVAPITGSISTTPVL